MKILIVQDCLRSGGTERQSILLAHAFSEAGHVVTLLTFRPGGALSSTVPAKVNRHSLQAFDTHLDWFAPGLMGAVRQIAPDIVLCMGRMANGYAGRLQGTFRSAAVVATMRTGKSLPGPFRRALHTVRHVVANSDEARHVLADRYGVARERISVIHNSLVFPPETALRRNETLRAENGAGSDTVIMLCVAMFRPEKNQRELIELAATLPASPPWQLWLAGDGPTRRLCERAAISRGLSDRVKFFGFQRDPSALYQAADIALHASCSESLSNFLIEAQSYGLPVVAYEATGISECFVPGQTGWSVPHGDRTAFLARLRPLVEDPALRQACAAPARAYARAKFDSSRQVQAYLDLFAQLIESRRTP